MLDTKDASAQFVASAERIFADVQKDARAQNGFFKNLIYDYSRLFAFLSLLCLAGAGAVFFYVNRSVIQRLRKLSDSMRGSVDGHTTSMPITGNDEIADMSRTFRRAGAVQNRRSTSQWDCSLWSCFTCRREARSRSSAPPSDG